MAKVFIQTRIEEEQKKQLEELAKANGISLSALIRLVLSGVVKEKDKALKRLIVKSEN